MKTFETPFVDVKKFDVMDVLTVSGCSEDCGEDECVRDECQWDTGF